MKAKRFLVVFLILAMGLVMTFSAASCGKEKTVYTLSLAHFFPATHPAEVTLVQGWAKALNTASNGQIVIKSYPGEALAKAADIYNAVTQGTADIGLSCFAYTASRFPVLASFELPGILYASAKAASMVAWEGIQTLNPAEIQDTHLLMVVATGPGDLFTQTPVRNLADLKDMEVRATGVSADTLKLLGAVPVGMPQSETYDSLSKGVVKANLAPDEVLKGWKNAEVVKYVTKTPFLYNTLFFVTMNKAKWDAIPADLQKIITDTTKKFYEDTASGLWDIQNKAGLEYAVNDYKIEVISLTEEETGIWLDTVKPIQDNYLAGLKDKGIDTDPLAVIAQLTAKYNALYK
jgi:TRAP-type transport system periplasmic protein